MQEYGLSNEEGVAIMCVAESLLRIPDEYTAQELISDKILNKNWLKHSGHSSSLFVNASTWGLFLTGKILSFKESDFDLSKLVGRLGENLILKILKKAIHTIANTFIIGRDIKSGVKNAEAFEIRKQRLSYDILGESSRNIEQVEHDYNQYIEAIEVIAKHKKFDDCFKNPSLSVKLSALHPRFELLQQERVFSELLPRVANIVRLCMEKNIAITFDAEEASRLDIYLMFIAKLISEPEFASYNGIGFVVQAYQRRAFFVLDFIIELAKTLKKRIPIRLVKGAYWDSEIKNPQELGLKDYPVFTRKAFTDISYLACAKKILANKDLIYPQFATHNAYTIAAIQDMASGVKLDSTEFEFQKLYGMGDMLHSVVAESGYTSRIYAPVGKYQDLLAYLMRRLLENGANTSFLNIVNQKDSDVTAIIETPRLAAIKSLDEEPKVPAPQHIFKSGRINSIGYDLGFQLELDDILKAVESVNISKIIPIATPEKQSDRTHILVKNPASPKEILAELPSVDESEIDAALKSAKEYFSIWSSKNVNERANILLKIGDLLHENRHTLYALLIKEAGKNIKDSIGEVREAIDFARYYAKKAVDLMLNGTSMDGYTGESNTLKLHPKGVFVCISPWNFPLAIFCGQIFAALVSGNTVIAKPSEIKSLIALYTTDIMYKAGIPKEALHLLLGSGSKIGAKLPSSDSVAGFCFTGSTNVARIINRTLAARDSAIATFIAETGGQNAMIVDSSALIEQVSDAILTSAFGSIGQRYSALRVVYIQEEV